MKLVGRPGAVGSRKQEIYNNYDNIYGSGKWAFVWHIGTTRGSLDDALALYDEAYHEYFKKHPDELQWIANNASDVYDNNPSNVQSGVDYHQQEYAGNHFQDIAIRRCVRDFGLTFKGPQLLQIRTRTPGSQWSPQNIPFHKSELIPQPQLPGWWNRNSIESFYQSAKYLYAENIPDYFTADLLIVTTNDGKYHSAQRSLGNNIHLAKVALDITEEQNSVEKIAIHKAQVARVVLCRPVLCDDSAFVIPSHNNYPRIHVGRELKRIGVQGFLKLAPAPAYFEMTLAYHDASLPEPELFTSIIEGTLIPELRGNINHPRAKSPLHGCFIPQGHHKTLAEMTDEEYKTHAATDRWERLKEFLTNRK